MIKQKLWTKNFFLLWQGRLVSGIGDRFYEIGLAFWILSITGSTAQMGTIVALSSVPRLLVSPFAGVIADNYNRKIIIILADLIRGGSVLLLGILTIFNLHEIWMLFIISIILGICSSFFAPAANSIIPDIVDKTNLLKANSANSMVRTGSEIFGNSLGGIIYSLLGAPLLFCINGISFILSALSEMFIKLPSRNRKTLTKKSFFLDLKDGFIFILNNKSMLKLVLTLGLLNFFMNIGNILFIPFFDEHQNLGTINFGIAAAFLSTGAFLGFLSLTLLTIKNNHRVIIYIIFCVLLACSRIIFPFIPNMFAIVFCFIVFGLSISIVNSFNNTILQLIIPNKLRGKVYSFLYIFTFGLSPIGMVVGGVLAEYVKINIIISISSFIILIGFLPVIFDSVLRNYIANDFKENSGK